MEPETIKQFVWVFLYFFFPWGAQSFIDVGAHIENVGGSTLISAVTPKALAWPLELSC